MLVSSGAVGMGMRVLGLKDRPRSLGLRQTVTTASLNNLAMALEGKGEDVKAERYYKQAVAMGEKLADSSMLAFTLHNYAGLLHKMGREAESKRAEARAKSLEK